MQQLLNEKENRFLEYMQGGQLPEDNEEALEFKTLAAQILRSFEQCDEMMNRQMNITYSEFMVFPLLSADFLFRGRVWGV
jgi:hypothetical protein